MVFVKLKMMFIPEILGPAGGWLIAAIFICNWYMDKQTENHGGKYDDIIKNNMKNDYGQRHRRTVLLLAYTVLAQRVEYFVLLYYSHKSWSIFKTRGRFELCWSWLFQNTPFLYNLTKFCLRYLRLKTHDAILFFHDNWFYWEENYWDLNILFCFENVTTSIF